MPRPRTISCIRSPGRSPANALLACIALGALALLSGCARERPTAPNGATPDLSSPAATLRSLRTAYEARDSLTYARLFDEDFTFVFTTNDLGEWTPPPWGLQAEVAAASAMFRDRSVDAIQLSFDIGHTVPSEEALPGACRVRVSSIHLAVAAHVEGIAYELRVTNGEGDFYFRRFTEPDGKPAWRIARWEDQPIPLPLRGNPAGPVREGSWGSIKLWFTRHA